MAVIQLRRGTAAQWTSANTVLRAGELGLETDTNKIKVGDGVVAWNTLDYNVSSGSTVADIIVGADAAASGTGGIAYDGATGTFTYTPPDIAGQETTTSLSIASNVLTYTDEDGVATEIDLNLYLDDTNLARLTSGTMNPKTYIATFTRDDGSTFDVDFSAVLHDPFTINVGADDSALRPINSGEGVLFLGGTNISTTSDLEGNITITNDMVETNNLLEAVTWADVPDDNITESSVVQHQAALTITESQISDLDHYDDTDFDARLATKDTDDLSEGTTNLYYTDARVRAAVSATGSLSYNSSTGEFSYTQPTNVSTFTNDAGYLTAETNDLSAVVTWVNVPDANITQSSVTQHQAALSITESQISDLQSYLLDITGENIESLANVTLTSLTDGQALVYDSATSQWVNGTGGSDVYLVDGGTASSIYTSGDLVLDGGSA
jgi:hypothetical protein